MPHTLSTVVAMVTVVGWFFLGESVLCCAEEAVTRRWKWAPEDGVCRLWCWSSQFDVRT
jgi:hypothetical protein